MNKESISDFCYRYFTATGCHIIEKSPDHLKVKLSPEADRDLTGRPYYWNFVERTGAEPETMSFMFVFDPSRREKEKAKEREKTQSAAANQSILGRYFGMPPIIPQPGRVLEEPLVFGTRRLEQIFQSACEKGTYLQLYEQPPTLATGNLYSLPYTTWLGINYKVGYICDMKKEQLVSLGISLRSGEIASGFHDILQTRQLSPRLPAHTSLRETISLTRAVEHLEAYMETLLKREDYAWANEAEHRMQQELDRVDRYYGELLRAIGLEPDARADIERQYAGRREEIQWQYQPRVEVSPINCGFFHLLTDTMRQH